MEGPPFRREKFFMHNRAMDVCLEIVRLRFLGEDFSVWHVRLWNLGYSGNPYLIDEVRNYKIMQKEYGNYTEITREQVTTPRTESGLPKSCPSESSAESQDSKTKSN